MNVFFCNRTVMAMTVAVTAALSVYGEIKVDQGVYWDTEDRAEGLRLLPLSESQWRTSRMETEKFPAKNMSWLTKDYFVLEYGFPCDFSKLNSLDKISGSVDVPSKIKDGALTFRTTDSPASFFIGAKPQQESIPPMRISGFFGPQIYHHLFLEIEFDNGEQQETEWQLGKFNMRHFAYQEEKPFSVRGRGRQIYRKDLGYLRNLLATVNTGGLKLTCLTKNAEAKIRSIRLGPKGAHLSWRYEFDLPFEAERCPFYFEAPASHRLLVNGKLASEDVPIPKVVQKTVDIAKYLKRGRNVIVLDYPIMIGWNVHDTVFSLLAEGAAISSEGTIMRLLGNSNWRYRFEKAKLEWTKPGADSNGWKTPAVKSREIIQQVVSRHGLNKGFSGFNPGYMGILGIAPAEHPYPVYNAGEKITWRITLPSAMKGLHLKVQALDAESGKPVMEKTFKNLKTAVEFPAMKPGAYWLKWSLLRNNCVLESRKTELVVAGRIEQEEIPFKDFEKELSKKLEPVYSIDCTKEIAEGPDFIDSRLNSLKKGESSVVTRNGLRYRETGIARKDAFLYRVRNLVPGEAYLVEVEIPDDKDRYIYCQVIESFLGGFQNNVNNGANGFPASSGTSATGGRFPLSGKYKKIRFLHVAGTSRASIVIANGASTAEKTPAAASRITFFRFKGGIPALKLPETVRGWGPHTERYLHTRWAAAYHLPEANMMAAYTEHVGAWIHNWKAHKTYISLLRYMGQNQVMQGTYMYRFGAPGGKFCEQSLNDGFDLTLLMAKMYAQNGIREYLSIEYMHPQHLLVDGSVQEVSDRQIWLKKARGIYSVDKNGNQVGPGFGGEGLNPFSKVFQKAYKDFIKELYRKYDGCGIKGLFVTVGFWWSPAIMTSIYRISSDDLSYDDDTIEQFEQETGIRLNADEPGRERFMKRHKLLTGKYRREWSNWRVRNIRALWSDIQKIVSSGTDRWEIILNAQVNEIGGNENPSSPFLLSNALKAQRDTVYANKLEMLGYRNSMYGKDGLKIGVNFQSKVYESISDPLPYIGINTNGGKLAIMKEQDTAIFTAGLNEFGIGEIQHGKNWWWKFNTFCGNVKRPAGEFAFAKELNVMSDYIPRTMVDNWMDNQPWFADDSESRRFAQGIYATPVRDYVPAKNVSGITALTGGDCLRLVNLSFHEVKGTLKYPGDFRELVWEKEYRNTQFFTLKPLDQLVFRVKGDASAFQGKFEFEKSISDEIIQTAKNLLRVKPLEKKIDSVYWEKMQNVLKTSDAYLIERTMNHYEIAFFAQAFFRNKKAVENQYRLEKMLVEKGVARINCAGGEIVDRKGNCWLADQPNFGFGSYGNEFANQAHRDPANPVQNTDHPEIFFTEAYGSCVFYTIPLPEGIYNIELLAAETYVPNKLRGRIFNATVNGETKTFDLYKLCSGFLTEAKQVWRISVSKDKPVFIQLKGEVGLNGIVIRKICER